MNHIGSARSLASAGSQRSHASASSSAVSTFEKHLPKVAENLEPIVSRGMRFALSPEVAGARKMAKKLEDSGTTYNVTVEPDGRRMFLKEVERVEHRPVHAGEDLEFGMPEVKFDDVVKDAIIEERHDRSVFRKERLRKFTTYRFIPALVTERLIPCWRAGMHAKTEKMTPAEEFKLRLQEACEAANVVAREVNEPKGKKNRKRDHTHFQGNLAFVTPTMCVAQKRVLKATLRPPDRTWRMNGVLDVHEAVHPPIRHFESGGVGPVWEELESERKLENKRNKKHWLGTDVIPSGIAASSSEEVQWVREMSKDNVETIRAEYELRRHKHQRDAAERRRENRGETSFDKFFRNCKAKEKAAAEEAAKAAAVEKQMIAKPFNEVLSLGLTLSAKAPAETKLPEIAPPAQQPA